jgi:hypothetical protein
MTSADIGFVPTVIVHYEAGKPHDPRFHIVGSKVSRSGSAAASARR